MSTTPTKREEAIGEVFARISAVTAMGATVALVEPMLPGGEEIAGAALNSGKMVVVPYISDDTPVGAGNENAQRYAFDVDLEILVPLSLLKGVLKPYQVVSRIHAAFYSGLVAASAADLGTLGGKALLIDTPEGYCGQFGIDSNRSVALTAFTCRVHYRHAWGDPGGAA